MLTINCPACGAPVNFKSKASVFAVCSFCKSSLVRQDMTLQSLGKMAYLQDEITPIQVGAQGTFDGKHFEVLGRMKIGYEDGSWNEWYIQFSDGLDGWLAEAQGFYAVCFELNVKGGVPTCDRLKVGTELNFGDDGTYEVSDIRPVHCLFSEGELPLQGAAGRKSYSVDLIGANGGMATIEYAGPAVRVFTGEYQDFDKFSFKHIRRFDGWQ